jgi:hypothetical protein
MDKGSRAVAVEALIREIQRYLAYVDAFRSANRPTDSRPRDKNERREDA